MDYGFGAARDLYKKGAHPRVLLGASDLPGLRRTLARGDGKKIAAAFRKRVRPAVREVLGVGSSGELVDTEVKGIGLAMDMAMLAVLDDDDGALEAVRRILAACPKFEARGPASGQPRHRLACSGGGRLAWAYDLVQPHLSPAERRAVCRWLYRCGVKRTLSELLPRYFLNAGQNIAMNQFLNTLNVLLAIDGEDGVPDLAADWARVLPMFEATLSTVTGPNGYPAEDMGYGTGMFARAAQSAETLRRAGIFDAYRECPRYEKFGNAMLHLVQPWGENLSTTGDHGDDIGARVFVLGRIAQETGDPTLLWLLQTLSYHQEVKLRRGMQVEDSVFSLLLADQFKKAVHPSKRRPQPATPFCDTARGIVTFRSGWKADDTFVVFDGSRRCPAAQGHEHASCGHFSLSAFGEYFAVDTGRYNIEQNCHNVTLVDGKSGRSTDGEWISTKYAGVLTQFAPGEFVDVAAVDSSHQHDCFWAWRHLGLVKGGGAPAYVWVVDDINKNNDWGTYWWQLHTCPENTIRLHKSHATVTGWRHGNKMDVHFALPGRENYHPPHRLVGLVQDVATPSSYKYVNPFKQDRLSQFARPADQIHYSTFLRPRLVAKIEGVNGRFLSVMLPRRKGQKPARVTRLASRPGSLAVRIAFAGVEDTLIFAHEHAVLEAADVRARGHWCVVRRDRRTGHVLERAVGEGHMLEVDGKRLRL